MLLPNGSAATPEQVDVPAVGSQVWSSHSRSEAGPGGRPPGPVVPRPDWPPVGRLDRSRPKSQTNTGSNCESSRPAGPRFTRASSLGRRGGEAQEQPHAGRLGLGQQTGRGRHVEPNAVETQGLQSHQRLAPILDRAGKEGTPPNSSCRPLTAAPPPADRGRPGPRRLDPAVAAAWIRRGPHRQFAGSATPSPAEVPPARRNPRPPDRRATGSWSPAPHRHSIRTRST